MGLFDNIAKIVKQVENSIERNAESAGNISLDVISENQGSIEEIIPAPSSRTVEDLAYGDDREYRISFRVNDAFKEAKSHAGEVEMLYTYAPEDEYGREGTFPYMAIQFDDDVYNPVEEFKETGTFTGALEITPLSGRFYFKAKMEYYEYIMYFYGMDRCDGFWKNNGLCMVYPKAYSGTENEKKLMDILDEAADSYNEEIKS